MGISVTGFSAIDDMLTSVARLRGAEFCGNVAQKLADNAAETGTDLYAAAEYAGTLGLTTVSVEESEEGANSRDIVISGDTALFIEFGTGVKHREADYGKWSELYPSDDILHHGEFGHGMGAKPSWIYKGDPGNKGHDIGHGRVRTSGNDPAEVVPQMAQCVVDSVPVAVQEVLKGID